MSAIPKIPNNIFRQIAATRREGGKSVLLQLYEACRMRLRKHPLGISEYFEYGAWHSTINGNMVDEFIGWRESRDLDLRLNHQQSRVLANDKLINYVLLAAAGLPSPVPIATYNAEGRGIGTETILRNRDEVLNFVRGAIYPCYVKPVSAGYGRGVMGLNGFDGDQFSLMDGTIMSVETFMKPFQNPKFHGMLFQKPLVTHPEIARLTGTDAISCVRFICFVTRNGPEIHTAFWKIVSGRNMVDNFSHGDFGNCLGAIDVQTGKITRAISRMGPGGQVDRHPTTGEVLTGFVLPDWQQACALVKKASAHFPGLYLQNWDVALSPNGPVLVELNTESELAVPQAISGRGLMDQRLRDILNEIDLH